MANRSPAEPNLVQRPHIKPTSVRSIAQAARRGGQARRLRRDSIIREHFRSIFVPETLFLWWDRYFNTNRESITGVVRLRGVGRNSIQRPCSIDYNCEGIADPWARSGGREALVIRRRCPRARVRHARPDQQHSRESTWYLHRYLLR